MANFGKWGALAGLGKGVMELARDRTEQFAAERQATIDEARERRLMTYQAKIDAAARDQSGDIEKELIGVRGDVQEELLGVEGSIESGHINQRADAQITVNKDTQQHATSERRDAEAARSEENALDRASRERIASMSTATAASIEASERFEFTKTRTVDNSGPFPVETEVDAIRDKETRQVYIPHGTQFVLQSIDPSSLGNPSTADIQALLDGKVSHNEFANRYGFLPAEYIQALPSQRQR